MVACVIMSSYLTSILFFQLIIIVCRFIEGMSMIKKDKDLAHHYDFFIINVSQITFLENLSSLLSGISEEVISTGQP